MGTIEIRVEQAPFDAVADSYDETFTASYIGRAQRRTVTRELDRVFHPGERVLEISCGTGVDALHLAGRGIRVMACDSSPKMVEIARRNSHLAQPGTPIDFRVLATENIGVLELDDAAGFDGAFSNFAGLNCVADLTPVSASLGRLLRPGAKCVLCFFGRICFWEILWYLGRRSPAQALRRLKPKPQIAQLGRNGAVEVHYHSIRSIVRAFAPSFRLVRWQGVGVTVPPSYLEPLALRFTRILSLADRADRYLGRCPGFRGIADHVLLTFERKYRLDLYA